ncbi:NAD(P)H-dependent oxidoreductase subunit E [Candidatus Igneacidithiobacillus taiwanensis]|uniref:NADH-quinone oxidoreductase subunit NuoE family protein n=1 Tax=Candidatus Igneacidithiobacillus taiwanensis TaxID=1945924 RepID=UPI0028A17176|nr:NAD(P)H-dependent oxidoreductase subunit E [Candidatus Igneacidithiobacillus taiwanensis]
MSSPTSIAESLPEPLQARLQEALRQAGAHPEAAVCELLRLLQAAYGWIDDARLHLVASLCGISPVRVEELCTFYPLVLRQDPGRHVLRICDSIACHLAGARKLLAQAQGQSGVPLGESNGRYSILPHVCLGLCDRAPAALVDGHTVVAPLSAEALAAQLDAWEAEP